MLIPKRIDIHKRRKHQWNEPNLTSIVIVVISLHSRKRINKYSTRRHIEIELLFEKKVSAIFFVDMSNDRYTDRRIARGLDEGTIGVSIDSNDSNCSLYRACSSIFRFDNKIRFNFFELGSTRIIQ